ncbi:MAG TPA: carboxy terminal-processing peptidase, partial [Kofleriaceae bacterium]|nr:carboxy terminal-processing peptidase [Kofleriaceae bacterium]
MRRAVNSLAWLLAIVACNSANPSTPPARGTAPPTSAAARLPKLAADPREATLAHGISYLLEKQHLRQRKIDDALSREAFAEYLDHLDPGKQFLLAEHIDMLRTYETRIDDELHEGNLELARTGAALLAERERVIAKLVADTLAKPLDYEVDESYESDPKKETWAASEQELAIRWRKQLKLQLLERLDRSEARAEAAAADAATPDAADDDDNDDPREKKKDQALAQLPFAEREAKARTELATTWAGRFSRLAKISPLQPDETFFNAITALYDPHTTYMPPADKDNFDIAVSGQLEGIGAVLGEDDHYIVVREVVPGGAAFRQGVLEVGDLIHAVAQADGPPVDVVDMPIDQAVQMIRGPKGTVVRITIEKPDGRVLTIPITRDKVEVEDAYARGALIDLGPEPDHPTMGYIYLPSFYGDMGKSRGGHNATDDVRALLEAFRARRLGGVIIDIRGNGGGLLDQAGGITGLLIDKGPVVQTRYSDGTSDTLEDENAGESFDAPVVVLVDRFSASASEILAAALQDYKRAVIVGAGETHGKGTVQAVIDLDRLRQDEGEPLGVLKLTLQQFFGIDGDSTQLRGVKPDILLPDPTAYIDTGETSLEHAIPWSRVAPLPYDVWKSVTWKTDLLVARSAQRTAASPLFAAVDKRTAFLKARREQTLVPLKREAFTAYRKKQREDLKALSAGLDDKGPVLLTMTPLD